MKRLKLCYQEGERLEKKKKKEATGIAEQLWDQPLTSRGSASHEAGLDQQAPSGHLREGSP